MSCDGSPTEVGSDRRRGARAGAFTREHLLRLLTSAPTATWRFDVDVSLDAAAHMARFAQLAGATGTFYVMSTGGYNPFSPASREALATISKCGHALGLHCDYDSHVPGPDVAFAVARQRALLDAGYPHLFDADLVSFHMPPRTVLWRAFPGFVNAYAPEWEGHYVSDARREWWPDKDEFVARHVAAGEPVQVALHSEHWFR